MQGVRLDDKVETHRAGHTSNRETGVVIMSNKKVNGRAAYLGKITKDEYDRIRSGSEDAGNRRRTTEMKIKEKTVQLNAALRILELAEEYLAGPLVLGPTFEAQRDKRVTEAIIGERTEQIADIQEQLRLAIADEEYWEQERRTFDMETLEAHSQLLELRRLCGRMPPV